MLDQKIDYFADMFGSEWSVYFQKGLMKAHKDAIFQGLLVQEKDTETES